LNGARTLNYPFAIVAERIAYCLYYGVVCGGVVDVSGLAEIMSGTIGSAYLSGAATRTATCRLGLRTNDPWLLVLGIVTMCPARPGDRPSDDCAAEAAKEFGIGAGASGSAEEFVAGLPGDATDAIMAYAKCTKGDKSGPSTKNCGTALKLLNKALGYYKRYAPQTSEKKLKEIAAKIANKTITSNDLLGDTQNTVFPGEFKGWSLKKLEDFCKK
jgi:hypothetical protein